MCLVKATPRQAVSLAIRARAARAGISAEALESRWAIVADHDFDPVGKHMSHVWMGPDGKARIVAKGALVKLRGVQRYGVPRKRETIARNEALAVEAGRKGFVDARWVGYQMGKLLGPDTILINDAVTNAGAVQAYAGRDRPLTYFRSGSSTGGWGSGAAVGAKIAQPDREVIQASGDGFYIFGTPIASLWAAHQHKIGRAHV